MNSLLMVYKRLFGDCPSYMSQMLIRNADINERPSRHGLLNVVCPRFKRESEGGRSFTVSTTRLWNIIPIIRKQSQESTRADWLKIVFV